MGNTLIEDGGKVNYMKAFETFIDLNLPNVTKDATLSENKLFKTLSYKTEQMSIIVKVCLMRRSQNNSEASINQEIAIHESNLLYLAKLCDSREYSNLLPFQKLLNFSEKRPIFSTYESPTQEDSNVKKEFLAVCRQQLYSTLKDKLSYSLKIPITQRHFMAYQILVAVYTLHSLNLYHGNIRSSNILLTSTDHVVLADFSPYKPYFLREDKLGENKTMFETSGMNCTLAPEKFVSQDEKIPDVMELRKIQPELLTSLQQMDMFSVGVVLAELYQDETLFTIEQLLQYRRGEYDPSSLINKIGNQDVQDLINNLIGKEKSQRFTSLGALTFWFDKILNKEQAYNWIYYLDQVACHAPYFSQPDLQVQLIRKLLPQLLDEVCGDAKMSSLFLEYKTQFKYTPPMVVQQMPVVQFFQNYISDIKPRFGDNQLFKPLQVSKERQTSFRNSDQLATEPFENQSNLKIKAFEERHSLFNSQLSVRQSQDFLRMTPVEKLRLSQRNSSANGMDSSLSINVPFLKQLDMSIQEERTSQTLLQDLKQLHQCQKSPYAHFLVKFVCFQLQNMRYVASKLAALEILEFLSDYMEDSENYYINLPHIGALFQDNDNQVILLAFDVFLNILLRLENPLKGTHEVKLFTLYYWAQIKKMLENDDQYVQRFAFERLDKIARVISRYEALESKVLKETTVKSQELIKLTQEKLGSNCSNQTKESIIQNFGSFFACFSKELNGKTDLLTHLITCFNNNELKICIIKNLLPIYTEIGDDAKGFFLTCLDQCLTQMNELQLFYTVRLFKQIAQKKLMNQQQEIKYLLIIAPLMVFPNLWVRKEAIGYVCALLEKYSQVDIYISVQPIVVQYLKVDVAFFNQEILFKLVGDMINRQNLDFTNKKIYDKDLTDREKEIYKSFLENYLNKAKMPSQDRDDQSNQGDQLAQRQDLQISLAKRFNDLIIGCFKANLFLMAGEDQQESYEELYRKYVLNLSTPANKINEQDVILELLKKYDVRSEQVTNRKRKYLNSMKLQLQSKLSQVMSKNLAQQPVYKNILNAIMLVHQVDTKARQIGMKEDVTVSRQTNGYPPCKPFKPQSHLVTTISEHKDVVTAVDNFRNQKTFISGSFDGTVRVYDMSRIDQDFTAGSVAFVKCETQEKQLNKVTTLRALEFTDSFLVGTNTGLVQLYKLDGQNRAVSQLRTFRKANSEIKKIESLSSDLNELTFVYVTSMGDIVVEDIRSKNPAIKFQVGKERGLVSSMIVKPGNSPSTVISTLNGYSLVYELRSNLISNVFQLLNPDDTPLSIMTMTNMKRVALLEGVEATDLIALGFQSNYNEVGFWNYNDLNENINPTLYLACSDRKDVMIQNPRLKSLYKTEQFKNFSNTLEDRCQYDFVCQQMDLISYLKDPLTSSSSQIKEKWLTSTKNCYANLKAAFEAKSTVTSMICLPLQKQGTENTIITASTDRCIQSWTLANDGGKPSEKQDQQGIIISQPACYSEFVRRFTQVKSADVYVIHDYELKNQQLPSIVNLKDQQQTYAAPKREYRVDHRDTITDMSILEREQPLLISASRDQTVKIWK